MPRPILTAQPFYTVISRIGDDEYLPEMVAKDTERETIIRHIAEEQYEALYKVLEINVVAGTCCDVTDEILAAVEARDSADGLARPHPQYVAWDRARALREMV